MDELGNAALAIGISVGVVTPFVICAALRERRESRKKVSSAEELLKKEELGAAYEEVKDVVREYGQCASKKTRKRAREIAYIVETRFGDQRDQILAEVREDLAGKIREIEINIDLSAGRFSIPRNYLGRVSETYRKHFIRGE
jgi:ribosomal protein S17E